MIHSSVSGNLRRRRASYLDEAEFTKAYPQAKLIGVEPLTKKRTDLHFHGGKPPFIHESENLSRQRTAESQKGRDMATSPRYEQLLDTGNMAHSIAV